MPTEQAPLGKIAAIMDRMVLAVDLVIVNVVRHQQIRHLRRLDLLPDGRKSLVQSRFLDVVIGIDHLEIPAARLGDALVHAAAPAGILLVDHADDIRMLLFVAARRLQRGIGRAVVNDDDLDGTVRLKQRFDTDVHVLC